METKAIQKKENRWPALFDSGWMEKFFQSPIDEFFPGTRLMNMPAVNVAENDKEFTLIVAAPGMDKKDFSIEAFDNMLTIGAEKETEHKEEKNGRFNRREYNFNSWSRSFTLPENCNASKIDAAYVNGELKIMIPKMEKTEVKKVKNIQVN
ncbi:MAG: Hsp20/alpha crystallin family protein [Chitinophagaceae bacterium]|nr:Hsp20/alpha crystallin family protein [Chitinophagaceae bacterium]